MGTKLARGVVSLALLAGALWAISTVARSDPDARTVRLIGRWDTGKRAAISWSAGPDIGHMPAHGDAVGDGGYWQATITVRRNDLVILVVRPVSMSGTVWGWILQAGEQDTEQNVKIGRDGFVEISRVIV